MIKLQERATIGGRPCAVNQKSIIFATTRNMNQTFTDGVPPCKVASMKIAFLISTYTDPVHLHRLIDSLPMDAHFFIHIDKSVDERPFRSAVSGAQIHYIDKRVRVMWGSYTQVQFQMELLRAALQHDQQFDYLFMLSGQDYPVWSNERIIRFLQANNGKNHLQGACLVGRSPAETRQYTRYRFLSNKPWKYGTLKSKFRVGLRRLTDLFMTKPLEFDADGKHYRLYKGSDYFAITRQLAAFLLKTYDEGKELRRYFSNSFAPSETFVHTVAFNSPFADSCILYCPQPEEIIRLKRLTPLTFIVYDSNIKELTLEDYDDILESDKMLCRKCVTGTSDLLMDRIDAQR